MKYRRKKRTKLNRFQRKEIKRNKPTKKNNNFRIIKIFSILILLFMYYKNFKALNVSKGAKLIIEVDISKSKTGKGGPIVLQRGISKVLPYETKYCKFIAVDGIYPYDKKNIDYFYMSNPSMEEKTYDKWNEIKRADSLLLGPTFVPSNWFHFPNKNYWYERRFREILSTIKGVVVHSERVRDHLMTRSNTQDLINKFIFLRSCTYFLPNDIKPFKEREYDIIFYQKYADSNHHKQGEQLLSLLNGTNKKIKQLNYGSYKREEEFYLINNSKFIIYFSFYDCGPVALKEIQNYGVITFALQKDFVINEESCFYIPELELDDMTSAFNKIIKIIDEISNKNPDSIKFAKINQNINRCERALDDLCDGIIKQ